MRLRNFLLLIFILFLVSFALFIWFSNRFSKGDVVLEIIAPEKLKFGQDLEYLVKIKNRSNFELEKVSLRFGYPEDFVYPDDTQKEKSFEVVYPGQEITVSFPATALGSFGDEKKAKAWLSYTPKGLSSFYVSETSKVSVIESIPFTLEIDIPSKVGIESETSFNINYFSNTDYSLDDLRIKIEYPSGFEFISSKPRSLEKNEWKVGPLGKAQGGRVNIIGSFEGQAGERKILKAQAILWVKDKAIKLAETSKIVELTSPEIFIYQEINGNPKYIASAGDLLHYKVRFKNIGKEPLEDLFLIVKLQGSAFDLNTIKADKGKFKPGDNTIIFDGRDIPELGFLDVQEEGEVEFWIELKDNWKMRSPDDKEHFVKDEIIISHSREEFITKIKAKVELSQKSFYNDDIFGNSGPLPPKVGMPTTYSVIWQVKTLYADVNNLKVRAKLAPNVDFTGKIFPESAKLVFDSESRELIWDIGEVKAGTGYFETLEAPSLSFQIKFIPKEDQLGTTPPLILETKLTAEDSWTGEQIILNLDPLDTRLLGGENLQEDKAKVVKNGS